MSHPSDINSNEFFAKVGPLLGKIAFIVDVVAMYYAMVDDDTPMFAKCVIAGALAYFILPFDVIPDVLGPAGYVDDAGVVAAALATVQIYVTDDHYAQARRTLHMPA